MPDCKPFSLLCTKNFLALAGTFLVTIAQGGAAYPGDCAECSVRQMSAVPGGGLARFVADSPCLLFSFLPPIPPARARRALFPAALAIPAPGERTISNAEVPLPRSPLSLAAGIAHMEPLPVVFAANRRRPCAGCPHGKDCKCRAPSSPRGCKGRSSLHKKTKKLPLPRWGRGAGGWGQNQN